MVKHINGWEISKRLQSDCKVYVKQFSGARTMYERLYETLRENPDHFILYVRANDLNTERFPEPIAKSIVDLTTVLKGNPRDVSVLTLYFTMS